MKAVVTFNVTGRHVMILTAAIIAAPLFLGIYKVFADSPAGSPVPRVINYDGTLEKNGVDVNGDFDFRFQLIDGYDEVVWPGSGEYAERTLPVSEGRFSVQFPDTTANPGEVALGDVVFETKPLKLKIAVRPAGTGAWTSFNRALIVNSVPFAVRAETAEVALDSDGPLHLNIENSLAAALCGVTVKVNYGNTVGTCQVLPFKMASDTGVIVCARDATAPNRNCRGVVQAAIAHGGAAIATNPTCDQIFPSTTGFYACCDD